MILAEPKSLSTSSTNLPHTPGNMPPVIDRDGN
jgi:hypothetical protein